MKPHMTVRDRPGRFGKPCLASRESTTAEVLDIS